MYFSKPGPGRSHLLVLRVELSEFLLPLLKFYDFSGKPKSWLHPMERPEIEPYVPQESL
jgi:hypothetical protein